MLSKFSILFLCLVAAASNQDPAPQILPASAGQNILSGVSRADAREVRVKVYRADGSVTQTVDVLVQQDHTFLAGFPKSLEVGQIAIAALLVDGAEATASAPILVQAIAAPATAAATAAATETTVKSNCAGTPIRLTVTPQDGQTTIYAVGSPSTDDFKCSVSVFVNGDETMLVNSAGNDAQSIQMGTDASFSLQVKDPLVAGQCVVLIEYEKGHIPASIGTGGLVCQNEAAAASVSLKSPATAYSISPGVLVTSLINLGRVRSYFTGGIVLAHDNGNFANANTFLAFNLDKNWLWGGPVGNLTTGAQKYRRMMFNTYFETRLTAIPVASGDSTTSATAREAATLAAGAYAPFAVTTWTDHRDPYALTLGPIAKVGFDTPITAASTSGTVSTDTQADFYTSFGFGGRVGISKMSYSKDVAPELISYLDVVTGRFSNFEGPAANDSDRVHRPWRMQLEGILKVPGYPLVIGFQANIRQNLGFGRAWQVNAKDDLRFFFGTRFDAGRAIAKLTGQK